MERSTGAGILVKFNKMKCKVRKLTVIKCKTLGKSYSDYGMQLEVDRPKPPDMKQMLFVFGFVIFNLQIREMLLALIRGQKELHQPISRMCNLASLFLLAIYFNSL